MVGLSADIESIASFWKLQKSFISYSDKMCELMTIKLFTE